MNKTITIYELLGLVKDGKAPNKIKFCDEIFTFNNDKCNFLYKYQIGKRQLFGCCKLNDTVEIIEDNDKTDEEAKPITKESIEALGYACGEIQKCFTSGWTKALENKPLKGNDKLEKIKWNEKESRAGILRTDQEIEVLAKRTETLKKSLNEIIGVLNERNMEKH